jgi:catechol 2,3-dioxygenase-like lactoylglutathione lyase family enzyme
MIDHTGITVSDLGRSRAFYERALAPLGYRVVREKAGAVGFGDPAAMERGGDPHGDFWLSEAPPAVPRLHFAFTAGDHATVDAFYAAALAAGGADNGPPGFRPKYHEGYYAAYVLDPDGYNIEAVCHQDPVTAKSHGT